MRGKDLQNKSSLWSAQGGG